MNLKDILSISGYPGLYKFLSQAKNGVIVESLIDKKRFLAYASAKVSALDDVAIYTSAGETPLKEVLSKILDKEKGEPAINPRTATNDELKSYFLTVLPDYNQEKVYISDIKKVLNWYNILQQLDMLNLPEEEEGTKTEEPESAQPAKEKVKAKAKTKGTGKVKK